MTPAQFLFSSLMLGLFVVLAGAYAVLYAVARLRHRHEGYVRASYAAYALQCGVATVTVLATPLDPGWKALVVASCLVYWWIPPKTFDYLESLHHVESDHS